MNEIEIVVTGKDKSDLDKIADKAKRAGKDIGDGIERGMDRAEGASQRASKSIQGDLQKVEKAGKDTGDGLAGGLTEALDGIASGAGGALGDLGGMLEGGIGAAKGGAIAAGVAVGAFVLSGIEAEFAEDRVGALIAAQTGAAASQSERLGDIAGNVFADSFGESIEEVGEAMTAVFQNKLIDTSAPEEAIERITKKVMTLSETTGEEANEISRSARQLLVTGLAENITQALDMIQHASEQGLNVAGDLFDTITEYSTNLRQLGLDGQEAFGLLGQAAEGGARDTDFAADALKEFSIRAQDMSETTRRGFESIGLDADVMGRRIAAGGSEAHDALRETLNALQSMPDPIERNSAAVDLFGTKAEDLGEALFHMDLDNASDQFGDFAGSVEKAAQKISDSQSGIDKFNKFVDNTKSGLGELLDSATGSDALDEIEQQINEIKLAEEQWLSTGSSEYLDQLKEKYPEAAAGIDEYIEKTREQVQGTNDATDAIDTQIDTIDELIEKHKEAAGGVLDLSEAQIQNQEALAAANAALAENGANLDLSTEKGRENQGALNDLVDSTFDVIEAMRAQGATSEEVTGFVQNQHDEFIRLATAMGMDAAQAEDLARKLGLVPGNYHVNIVMNDVDIQKARAESFKRLIESIPNEKVVNLRISSQGGGHHLAGLAHGGIVPQEPWGAATGGQRHSSTVINEAGPEVVELPSGARVATAGATRAMAEAGWLGGNSAAPVVNFVIGSPTDELGRAIANWLRRYVKDEYGGNVASALGQRTSA